MDHAARTYAELTARCERVFVGGESLGGLLSLYLGSAIRDRRADPVCAGLRIASPLVYLSPLFKFLVKALPKRRVENDPDSAVNQRWNGYTVDPVPAVAQVLPLQRQVPGRLPLIKQPIISSKGGWIHPEAQRGREDHHLRAVR